LAWESVLILIGGLAAKTATICMGLLLTGLGIDWIVGWMGRRNVVRLDHRALTVSVALIVGLPLGMAQASSLWQRYQFKPVVRHELEQQAADWLRVHSDPMTRVFGSERLGYLAGRATFPWDGDESDQSRLASLLRELSEDSPDYCVSSESIGWNHLAQTGWFRNGYKRLQQFESPYDVTSPLTVWGRRSSAFDEGEFQPLSVRLPDGVNLVGCRYWPERAQPGDAVYVTLYLQATQLITDSFRPVVRVSLPQGAGDWMYWWQMDTAGDRSVPVGWWQTGQVIADWFVLKMGDDTPTGAYRLDVLMMASDEESFLPMYQHGDTAPVDRVMLGYMVVPWQGRMDLAKLVGARFGDRIALLGFEAVDSLSPGAEFDVALYWEAQQPPEDDYVVFVHLMDASGRLVASHDGPPMGGRFPTRAWLPGDVVPDVHQLVLDPGAPAGVYRLQVGMYNWPSMERLPIWDEQGAAQPDHILFLQSVEVQ
jgi:hypothetical protein